MQIICSLGHTWKNGTTLSVNQEGRIRACFKRHPAATLKPSFWNFQKREAGIRVDFRIFTTKLKAISKSNY